MLKHTVPRSQGIGMLPDQMQQQKVWEIDIPTARTPVLQPVLYFNIVIIIRIIVLLNPSGPLKVAFGQVWQSLVPRFPCE